MRTPFVHIMPRVKSDIRRCIAFLKKQPYGQPRARQAEILLAIDRIYRLPRANRVCHIRRDTGIKLRKRHIAQFVIIYAYIEPNDVLPDGMVSIRAVRHRRMRNVFRGVKDEPFVRPISEWI